MKTRDIILISLGLVASVSLVFILIKRNYGKRKLIDIALSELKHWKYLTELSPAASSLLVKYWKSVGKYFTKDQMMRADVHASWPWSSAFISYLFFKWGAKEQFPYSASHTTYFQFAKANRDNPKASLRGFRIDEYKPKEGDLLVYSNERGKGYHTSGWFRSHGELITKVGKGFLEAIGGNVSNTVKLSRYTLDANGYLTKNERDVFMVIQNNIR